MNDPSFFERINRLVVRRGLDTGVAEALIDAADVRYVAQLEACTDEQLAEVSTLWRDRDAAERVLRARAALNFVVGVECESPRCRTAAGHPGGHVLADVPFPGQRPRSDDPPIDVPRRLCDPEPT